MVATPVYKVNELNEAEEPACALLQQLGYQYVPREQLALERDNEREVLLKGRLQRALLRLNPWLNEDQAGRAIFKLQHIEATGIARNRVIHEYLTYGLPLDVDEPGGRRTRTVHFFDFDYTEPHDGRNEYVVTRQMRIRRGNEKPSSSEDDERLVIPDLVLFVNGIPMVVIEAKSRTLIGDVWKAQAVRRLLRYQEAGPEWHGRGAPELFDWNLLCVALSGAAAAYGAIGASENEYAVWKSVVPYDEKRARERFGQALEGQGRMIVGLLSPAVLLDILRDFVVYEPEKGRLVKKLPRYQQYRAVTAAMERVLRHEKPEERGGVIWHTQGSGKSLTMLWLATKLRRERRLSNPTIVLVTDRTQLDDQITGTFKLSGISAPEHASNTRKLRELLTTGFGRTISTTIQKFQEALSTPDGHMTELNPASNVFVMVDEAHRTQYGPLAALMRKALPSAVFLGFTGTPIDKSFSRTTMGRFGPLIDTYTIPQAVMDGATVPIFYEARLPDLAIEGPNTVDKLFDAMFGDEPQEVQARIRRRYANKETLAEAEKRIERIALDIAEHFQKHVRPNGFKAQVVAPSRIAAVEYAERLRSLGIHETYEIITTSNDDGVEFDNAKSVDQKDIIARFKDPAGTVEILVVVDMLLTGFDAPVEQVLYLDRGLREHGLLQAIARVNRRCTLTDGGVTTEKTYGLVVDYWGVSQDLASALSEFERKDTEDAWQELPADPAASIDEPARQTESFFTGLDLDDTWSCVHRFEADARTSGDFKADEFGKFSAAYRDFAKLLDRFLPDPRALPYVARLTRLTKIRAYARATFLREDTTLDWADISAKVKQLIDSRIDADVRELMKPVSILDPDLQEKLDSLPHPEARASVMEHALRAQITERMAENPVFYEKLSERLQAIIDQMRQHLIDAATAVTELWVLQQEVLGLAGAAARLDLSEVAFAVYELIERQTADGGNGASAKGVRETPESYQAVDAGRLKAIAQNIEEIIGGGQNIVDWQHNEEVQRVMRRDIKRELRGIPGLVEPRLSELAASMVEIARRKTER